MTPGVGHDVWYWGVEPKLTSHKVNTLTPPLISSYASGTVRVEGFIAMIDVNFFLEVLKVF